LIGETSLKSSAKGSLPAVRLIDRKPELQLVADGLVVRDFLRSSAFSDVEV
jgi:hypothetical protein